MENSIFLLTSQKETERIILDSIPLKYNLISITTVDLIMKLYEKAPSMLLVDLDNLSEQSLEMVNSTVSLMYLPVIYIYTDNYNLFSETLKEEVVIKLDRVSSELGNLIKQGINFKAKYDIINESYDAIDLLSGNIKGLLGSSMSAESFEKDTLITELFNLVLSKNKFISNKPDQFWIIQQENETYVARLFTRSKNGDFTVNEIIKMETSLNFAFDISFENGFYKNFFTDEISDIASSSSIFPDTMLKASGRIRNFAGFSIDEITIIGMNYSHQVSNYDISIIRGITIYFDLINTIKTKVQEIEKSFEYTTSALARAAEVNDDSTGSHIKRVNTFSKLLAEQMGMDREFIKTIFNAAQMHDVGKIYVDKNILTKPGKLTEEEFEDMKRHTIYGEIIIGDSKNLKMSAEIARNHHEKYDGTGYPDGKKGEEIPLAARIVALADIYDALRSKRSYKPGFTHQEAYNIITKGDGRVMPQHFDPEVLEAFRNIHLDLAEIFDRLTE